MNDGDFSKGATATELPRTIIVTKARQSTGPGRALDSQPARDFLYYALSPNPNCKRTRYRWMRVSSDY
ncbi:hypothetical protein DSM3645_23331 [Blastopirellula marina DSM 3645]|uniref:Uncharacterized protein n=1 Tax=Blastopirellula marina DSM 3645 TaxID=314230 RepID=A3ZQA3_9BACT|nr:hypothetical protein DSM3645_23331 [Blastopirellula marina DSM 3645]